MTNAYHPDKKMVFNRVSVIGSGFMGAQIALQTSMVGKIEVLLYDISTEAQTKASKVQRDILKKKVDSSQLTPLEAKEIISRIKFLQDFKKATEGVSLIIETIPEKLELKRELFEKLDKLSPKETIIVTNSSSIKCSLLENVVVRKERIANLHFYPPVWGRPMVEIMGGAHTSQETIDKLKDFAKQIGLTPLLVKKEITGFLFNRIWRAIKKEAMFLADGGYADYQDIDRAWMIATKMPTGIFGLLDMVSLDVIKDVCEQYYNDSKDEKDKPPKILLEKINKGELGVKTNKGFYTYPDPIFKNKDWLNGL